jgi:hypothetical protein
VPGRVGNLVEMAAEARPMTYHHRVPSTSLLSRCAPVVAVLLLAVGCGDDEGDAAEDPSADTSGSASVSGDAADLPACDTVWVAGETLPRDYRGCVQDGAAVKPDKHPCSYGAAIVQFADRFYAVTGKQVNEVPSLADSEQFQQALTACQG